MKVDQMALKSMTGFSTFMACFLFPSLEQISILSGVCVCVQVTLRICIPARSVPCILPEKLFPWLIERGLFWKINNADIRRYWQHHQSVGSEIAGMCPEQDAIPIWLWGDAASYNAKNESVMVLCAGCILDDQKCSLSTSFPFAILREESPLHLCYGFV